MRRARISLHGGQQHWKREPAAGTEDDVVALEERESTNWKNGIAETRELMLRKKKENSNMGGNTNAIWWSKAHAKLSMHSKMG